MSAISTTERINASRSMPPSLASRAAPTSRALIMFGEDGVPLSGRFTTLYPFPGTTSVKPWSAKSLYTLLAVLRLIPSSAASVRQLGNQLPTGYSPIDILWVRDPLTSSDSDIKPLPPFRDVCARANPPTEEPIPEGTLRDGQALATDGLGLANVASTYSPLSYAIGHLHYTIVLKVCQ